MEAKKIRPPPKRKIPSQDSITIEMELFQEFKIMELHNESSDHKLLHQPQGSKATKVDQKNTKFKTCALRAQ